MSLTDKDVAHVARLARLALSDEEKVRYGGQLTKILDHIATLNKYDVKDVPATSHVVPMANAWREDVVRKFADQEALLSNAPDREDVFFKVKKIIE